MQNRFSQILPNCPVLFRSNPVLLSNSPILLPNNPVLFRNKYYNSTTFLDKIRQHPYVRLCRYEKPIGALLLYWPVTWGLVIGAATLPSLSLFAMFFMGAWTSRAAGCIINDYLDREFDKKVERTKDRPLASGAVSLLEAGALLLGNLCGGLYVLTQLPLNALLATGCILPIAALYPLAKRYTCYPQLVLGIAFNSGVVIGGLCVASVGLNWGVTLAMYGVGVCWTLIYDTVYAFQDISDDKKLKLFSTAITWEDNPKLKLNILNLICLCMSLSTGLFDSAFQTCVPGFLLGYFYLSFMLKATNLRDRQSCGRFFKRSSYYGLIVLLALLCKFADSRRSNPRSDLSGKWK